MSKTIGTVLVNVEANTQKLIDGFNSAEKRVDSAVSTMKKSVIGLTTAYLSFEGIVGGGKMFLQQADAMNSASSRLKLVTANSQELLNVQKQLFDIAQKSGTDYLKTIDLYTDISRSAKEYNIEQSKLLTITDTISKATIISGKDAVSTQAALTQLGQAFTANFKSVGEELGSLRTQAPRVYQAMVEGMGVTSDQFKKMAEDGKLSTNIIVEAFIKGSKSVDSEATTMVKTIEQSLTQASNSSIKKIGELNKELGATDNIAKTISNFTKAIDEINTESLINTSEEFLKIGAAIGTAYLGIKTYNTTTLLLTATNYALGGSYGAVNRSILLAIASQQALNLVMKATPLGLATAAVYGLSQSFIEGKTRANSMKIAIDELSGSMDTFELKSRLSDVNKELKEYDERFKGYNDTQKMMYQGAYDLAYKEQQILLKSIDVIEKKKKANIEPNKNPDSNSIIRDDSAVIKIMGSEFSKFNLELDENIKKLKNSGATQAEVDKYRADSIKNFNEKQQKDSKKTNDELIKQAEETSKSISEIKQIGMSEYEKGLISITEKTNEWIKAGVSENDILIGKNKLLNELNSKNQSELLKEELGYYERKVQLMDDSISKELELQGISYASRILEIEQTTKSIAEKDKLIAKETDLYNLTVQSMNLKYETEFQDTMSNFYDDMLDSQIALNNAVFDFGSGFDGASSKIGAVSKSLAAMSSLELTNKKEATALDKKYIEQFVKYSDDIPKTKELEAQYIKDNALLNEQNIQAQINGYANIAGAMSGMFEQGTKEAATFQMIESGLAVVSGVRAILSQGSGDPYTAFARMAAMTASVMSLLQSAKIAFGTSSETKSFDTLSKMTANEGAGTVLGDTAAQSESIVNSMEILKEFAQPQYETLLSMNKYLSAIANGIGGVSSLLVQEGGYAFGAGFTSTDSGWKNKVSADKLAVGLSAVTATTGGLFAGTLSKALDKVSAGIFGKTSVTSKMKDSGMYFADQLLTEATKSFIGSAYQTVETTTTTKSWFDKSTSTSSKTKMAGLSNETERQFTMVIDNLYQTTLLAGDALDTATSTVENSLSNFVVSLGKISLYKKSGDEIQKTLEAVFGKLGDQIAGTAFPLLNQFQSIGEGLFTTMTRVATGMEEAEFYIGRLGSQFKDLPYWEIINKRGNVGFEALIQSISRVEASTYPVNNNLMEIVSNLDSTAEELYSVYTALDELRDRLIFLGQSAEGISSSMIKGAGSADALFDGFNAYFENFLDENEQLKYKTEQLTDEFQKLGLALPISKDSFKALLSGLNVTSTAGQELYGRLIILSESFANIADATTASIEELTTSLDELTTNSFDSFISSLDEVGNTLVSIKNTALGFVQGFTTSGNASLKDQLIAYNKLRSQFSTYFDETGLKAGVNQDTVNSLYSSISTLAQNISGKDDVLKNSLISQFESDIFSLDSSTDVLRVNIVEGLSKLEGLNEVQKNKLVEASMDGKLTNLELNNIAGLTATQKDNIIKFASNSDLFSTEGTLSNLETYAKAQLEIIQKQNDAETSNISAQTFSYDDYIGKQEQIDISKTLGVSYASSKDFIEKLQDLSISTDFKKDLSSILGYSGYEYDLTKASQITSLSQYLNPNVATTLNQIKDESGANIEQRNIFEAARSDFYKRLSFAEQSLSSYSQQMKDAQASYAYWDAKVRKTDNGSSNYDRYKDARYAAAVQIRSVLPNLINSTQSTINSLYDEKALKGFALGGYTGDIPTNAIAGFVHGGEHVLDANVTSQVNQIGSVADMVNQYTNINFYQKMNDTFSSMKNEISNLVKITVQQANELKKLRKEVELGGTL